MIGLCMSDDASIIYFHTDSTGHCGFFTVCSFICTMVVMGVVLSEKWRFDRNFDQIVIVRSFLIWSSAMIGIWLPITFLAKWSVTDRRSKKKWSGTSLSAFRASEMWVLSEVQHTIIFLSLWGKNQTYIFM